MTQERNRDRVMAEVTSFHLMRLANEHGCHLCSREQAINAFDSSGCAKLITRLALGLFDRSVSKKSGSVATSFRQCQDIVMSGKGLTGKGRSSSKYSWRNLEERLLLEC